MDVSEMKFQLKLMCCDCGCWVGNVGSASISNINIQCPRCALGWR